MRNFTNREIWGVILILLMVVVFGSLSAQAVQTGSIDAWGHNDEGQLNVPVPNSGFIAIAAGRNHSLGLKDDGSVAAWGRNIEGPLVSSNTPTFINSTPR